MNKLVLFTFLAMAVAAITLLGEADIAEAATCNPVGLSPCAGAMSGSGPPSKLCCSKLREQKPCLCGYYRDPNLRQYVDSPNAKKVATACDVHVTC
uniref:Non-specific lipid-transfer protein type 2 n=1 Tax=Tamarix hispida TaxID=189793 RepID=C0KHK8_9CARY|nr:non-specific lipid-transfer protein type 2 [Tamarix hispida]